MPEAGDTCEIAEYARAQCRLVGGALRAHNGCLSALSPPPADLGYPAQFQRAHRRNPLSGVVSSCGLRSSIWPLPFRKTPNLIRLASAGIWAVTSYRVHAPVPAAKAMWLAGSFQGSGLAVRGGVDRPGLLARSASPARPSVHVSRRRGDPADLVFVVPVRTGRAHPAADCRRAGLAPVALSSFIRRARGGR